MTPTAVKTILKGVTTVSGASLPSRTYHVDYTTGRIQGVVDGQEAMVQAVRKILNTDRFAHLIYSWNYGTEWNELFGKSHQVVESELSRILTEALEQDTRITGVRDLTFAWTGRRACQVTVAVETIFGTIQEEVIVSV